MRAVVLENGRLSPADIPEPVPAEGEVLVTVLACGICGTDLHCVRHGEEFDRSLREAHGVVSFDLTRPVVLGHEFVGRVVAHGPGTTGRIREGSRVVCVPVSKRPGHAPIGFAGPETPGGLAERMVLPEDLLIEVPGHVPTELAALTEPLAVAHHTVARGDLGDADVPLVVGCGPIGLAVVAVLRARGAEPVVAADFSPERRALAKALGADVVVDPATDCPYEVWARAASTAGRRPRPTVAFECVGAPGVLGRIIGGAPARSRIVVAGLCMTPDVIEPAQAVLKELELRFAMMYSAAEFAETFDLLARGAFDVAPLITRTVGLADVPAAFESLASSPADAKVLVDPSA